MQLLALAPAGHPCVRQLQTCSSLLNNEQPSGHLLRSTEAAIAGGQLCSSAGHLGIWRRPRQQQQTRLTIALCRPAGPTYEQQPGGQPPAQQAPNGRWQAGQPSAAAGLAATAAPGLAAAAAAAGKLAPTAQRQPIRTTHRWKWHARLAAHCCGTPVCWQPHYV